MPAWVSDPIPVDSAFGTFSWVNSGSRTTIVSDNIAIDNEFFSSQSNIQVSIISDSSPVIDLRSNWSIEDIAAAKAHRLPGRARERLYR